MQLLIWLLGILTYGSTEMSAWVAQGIMYLFAVIDTGDWMNDWRTHIEDANVRAVFEFMGRYLVEQLGL